MSERLVLALDGSTRTCGAALLNPRVLASPYEGPGSLWEVLGERTHTDSRGQGRVLLRMVDEILAEAGAGCNDIGAIVVGTGPGTFTGVRIAVATARALSLALSVPVAGVSTLAALASAVARDAKTNLVVPVVDARRDQVFYGLYRSPGGPEIQRWVRRVPYGVCDRHALAAMLDGPATVVAEDAALVGELPQGAEFIACDVQAKRLVYGQRMLTEPGGLPQGARLTPWLIEVLVAGGRPDPEAVKPIYVRAPDADIHITKMKDPWAENASRGPQKEGR